MDLKQELNKIIVDFMAKNREAVKRILKSQRLLDHEYRKLAREYRSLTGKYFKRNGWDMHNNHSKLQAIKIRIKQIQYKADLKSALEDIRKKNGSVFYLSGAL